MAGETDSAAEIELLLQKITRMRADHESRIAELERRLDQSEEASPATATSTADPTAPAATEITMSANVDDRFTAMLNLPVVVEDGETSVELEEAWVETTALPTGLAVRPGRMQADIGYLNTRHFHAWDFADQALVYQAFLGGQYIDDDLQFR